ncbi:hypothetical protein HG536_0H00550 [Torulaspora globosa]|uniref:Zn(2)-C6 fungal-type domain-containing protein n=1 Tax=Torulaspora globosa TaxID=48254 RepID=A0A7G3ZME4_9SACH|nr:uncharacterized protein HG536_0H00550 [Torulaspora globosa]QLL34680.1 hypothetical protein HG536_0H00550 [Torulaspora globosa]
MKSEKTVNDGPKIIRTMGSQALGGLNSLASGRNSQNSSMSRSPSAGVEDGQNAIAIRGSKKAKSPSVVLEQTPSQRLPRLNTELAEVGSFTSVSSMGNSNLRVAQACDRCRSKKTRCDGKRPQCSQCAAVGFECKISDKLSRRAFPRGYTETLEERVRELEAENRRLVALCDIKEQQIHLVSHCSPGKGKQNGKPQESDEQMLQELRSANGGQLRLSSTNLFLLNRARDSNQATTEEDHGFETQKIQDSQQGKTHMCDGLHCSDKLHSKPVSTSLNDPTCVSFEQDEAPGLPAVKALTTMATRERSTQLAALVALSVLRSTEEILFMPQLLARIMQIHGFTSKQCLYTVSLLSSLKSNLPEPQLLKWDQLDCLKTTNLWEIDNLEQFFSETLKFRILEDGTKENKDEESSFGLSIAEIDELVELFFEFWSPHIPILDRQEFFSYYNKLKSDVETQPGLFQDGSNNFTRRNNIISYKIFACILFTVCQMGLLMKVKRDKITDTSSKCIKLISYYHRAISLIYSNAYFSVLTTSLQSVQFLSLLLFYFLNTGNVSAVYELRGRVVSMAQQLRLHRCPSAVLSGSGSTMNKMEQGDRRVLFWGIYYLDVFSALQLGVPRLIKDFEIECALPVADNENKKVNLAGQMIRLEGHVSQFSLAMIRYAKVLGNILDTIFKRGMTESITKKSALIHENALDNWRRGLPHGLTFEIDVNGTINMDEFNRLKQESGIDGQMKNMILILFYFLAKCMIHLPVIATTRLSSNDDSNGEMKDENSAQLDKRNETESELAVRSSSSYVLLQQATNTMLGIMNSLQSIYLPLPINVARQKTVYSLISARGSLEYIKGGALYLDSKALLLDVVKSIEEDRKLEIPGIISWHSLKLLDMTINLLLQPANIKVEKLDKLLKKKLNYYNRLMGQPMLRTPSGKQEVSKKRKSAGDVEDYSRPSTADIIRTSNLTPVSSKSDDSPQEKRVKLEDEPEKHTGLQHSKSLNQTTAPVATQTAIAEALQLDPVLSSNILSDADLAAFFGGHLSLPNSNLFAPVPQPVNPEKSVPPFTGKSAHDTQLKHQMPNSGSKLELDGLFRVPSNANFLIDEHFPSGGSQLDLALLASNHQSSGFGSNGNNPLRKQNDLVPSTNHPVPHISNNSNPSAYHDGFGTAASGHFGATAINGASGFNFSVDASLGLAPLLDWSPEMHHSPSKTISHHSDNSGIILDSTIHHEEELANGSRAPTTAMTRTGSGQGSAHGSHFTPAQSHQVDQLPTGLHDGDDPGQPMLTLGSRRGPRRRHMAFSSAQDSGLAANRTSRDQDLNNLFYWQNSK